MVASHEGMGFAEASFGAGDGGEEHRPSWSAVCGGTRFTMLGVEPLQSWGDLDAGYAYARLAHGAGTVDVVADSSYITNRSLENPGAAELARTLLQPGWQRGTVHLGQAYNLQ